MTELSTAFANGLWHRNAALVQLLGLCPLLAVTTTAVNGIALGLATTIVLIATNTIVSTLRSQLIPSVRIPIFVLIIASLVTSIDLLMNAFFFELHTRLGLFVPLIITNCAILAQAESVASREAPLPAAWSGLATGLGFAAVLAVLGMLRELLGQGTLFAGIGLLLGDWADGLSLDLPFDGLLAVVLPPGAFFGLAALLALRNAWLQRAPARESGALVQPKT
jgi:electron transport complex protein RnfE